MPCMQDTPNCITGAFGYMAGPGYDLVTGLGSLDFSVLATNWSIGAPTVTTLTATPGTIGFNGGNVQLTATVTATGGTPSGNVTFLYNDTQIGTAALSGTGTSATATLTISAIQLPIGSDTITAAFNGSSSLNGSARGTGNRASDARQRVSRSRGALGHSEPDLHEQPVNAGGYAWVYTVILTNQSTVATTLTKFTIGGFDESASIKSFFGTASIPANASILAGVSSPSLSATTGLVLGFGGMDASGATWSQQITVPVVSRVEDETSLLLTTPATVPPNTSSNTPGSASCQ